MINDSFETHKQLEDPFSFCFTPSLEQLNNVTRGRKASKSNLNTEGVPSYFLQIVLVKMLLETITMILFYLKC